MAATAFGLTRPDGRDPAECASTSGPPYMRANASAIWLRLEFSTQTNTTRGGGMARPSGPRGPGVLDDRQVTQPPRRVADHLRQERRPRQPLAERLVADDPQFRRQGVPQGVERVAVRQQHDGPLPRQQV